MTKSRNPINMPQNRTGNWTIAASVVLALAICLIWAAMPAGAQTAGEGSIEGTVTDSTGAVISNAAVTVTNTATGTATVQKSSSAGFYSISPLLPGTYTIQVVAQGFKTLVQDNVVVDALQTRGFNPVLTVGAETQTVTVTGAPPVLDTADATLGNVMENQTYSNLPLQMNGLQRDPTAFGVLTPGAQAANNGARLPIIGGTGSYLGQLYLDGMPAETVSQQGDNRLVSESMDLDAVDQFQLVTSTPPAEYMGAGAENFTMKSGGLQYHGQVSDFVRNTIFDSWSFTAKAATTKNALGATVPAPKPVEHQDELSASVGGVVPFTGKRLFFFTAYDKYHYRKGASYSLFTVPTTLMMAGDFTELNGNVGSGGQTGTTNNAAILYDPTTNKCVGTTCTRTPFQGTKNGVATNNVIPSNEISPIAKAMESFMPAPTNPSVLVNNYLGGYPGGYDNHVNDWRVDYDISSKQRISSVGAMGTVGYVNNYGSPFLPPPYIGGDLADIYPKDYVIGDTYTFSPNVVNQLKASFTRFFQNIHDATQGVTAWEPTAFGITNLPAGQAGQEFPGASFGTTTAYGSVQTTWTGNGNSISTQLTTPNNYALTDNVQWLKGKHSLTIGLAFQWEEINNANPATFTGVLDLAYNAYATANFGANSNSLSTAATGYSYASYLLGAVGGSPSIGLQPVSELGGRYKTIAPYVDDIFKVTPKLTATLGLRWDYLPPFHEVKNRWTFLNPTLTNPLSNSPGMLEFAGSYGGSGVSCNCKTPVQTYYKHWGPRLGLAYSYNPKTVLRAGFAVAFTQAGGVGGRGGAAGGTGQTGFNMTAIGPIEATTGNTAAPSFYLNNSTYFGTLGLSNTGLFGPGFTYPATPSPNVAAQELNAGYVLCPASGIGPGGAACTAGSLVNASSVSYADPYLSGRAPELVMFNLGVERSITQNMTLAVNYMGNESHFIINSGSTGGNARGLWTNEINPTYLAALAPLAGTSGGPLLTSQATAANIAKVTAALPNVNVPAFYATTGAASSKATIAQMLVAFPQYSGVSDTWGNVGNFAYHALQVIVNQRMSDGLTFNFNYTYAKNIGDDGTYRTGFDIPAAAISRSTGTAFKQDRIDRSYTVISIPQIINAYGVYQLPFGKGHLGGNSFLVRQLAGGWQFSSIFSFKSGTPMAVTWSGSTTSTLIGQGQAMPDLNPAAAPHSGRINGSWGKGPNGYTTCNLGINGPGQTGCTAIQYVNPTVFLAPQNVSPTSSAQYLIGNAPRTAALGLRNPHTWDLDTRLSRTFPIHENLAFQFEVDCLNTWNNVVFGNPGASWSSGSASFGAITGISNSPRDYQFAGHINF
jgi:hypothetical protein